MDMPRYIPKALEKLQYLKPRRKQHIPFIPNPVQYGSKQQLAITNTILTLEATEILRIQSIIGTCLFYTRMIDSTIITTKNDVSQQQIKATETMK